MVCYSVPASNNGVCQYSGLGYRLNTANNKVCSGEWYPNVACNTILQLFKFLDAVKLHSLAVNQSKVKS